MRRWIVGYVGLALLTTLVPRVGAGATPDPLFPAGLDWKPGPTCVYDINHNGTKARWTFSVSEASGGQIKGAWSREDGVSIPVVKTDNGLKFAEDMSMVHGTPMTADPPYQWIAFPLEPKKAWEGRSAVSGTDSTNKPWKVEVNYKSKVSGWEKLKIPAGQTMALKIVSDERLIGLSGDFSGTSRTTTWMGSGACSLKKLEYKNSFGERAGLVLVSEPAQ